MTNSAGRTNRKMASLCCGGVSSASVLVFVADVVCIQDATMCYSSKFCLFAILVFPSLNPSPFLFAFSRFCLPLPNTAERFLSFPSPPIQDESNTGDEPG